MSDAQVDDSVEIGDIWRILWHRRWIIAVTALVILASTLIYCVFAPPLYTATAEILIDPRDKQVLTNNINPVALPPDGGVTQVESQSSVIGSSSVLLRAIADTNLTEDPEFGGPPGFFTRTIDAVERFFGLDQPVDDAAEQQDRTLRALKRRLAIKRADKVFVIDVIFSAKTAERAARVANAIADAYLADQSGSRAASATEASDSLAARLDEQRKKVNEAESAVERYRAENNITAANGMLVTEQQLTDVSNQLTGARSRSAELLTRVNQIEDARRGGVNSDATAEALNSSVISALRAREAALVERDADLRTQLGGRHPALLAVASQLADVRKLVAKELDRLARSARADYDRAAAYEKSLSTSLDGLKAKAEAGNKASVRLRELEREADANRTVYNSFLVRSQETREQASIDTTNARIITRAIAPQEKSWPPVGFLLLGALGGGLGLGAGAALVREYVAPSILSKAQMQRAAGVPVVGVWPMRNTEAAVSDRPRRRWPGARRAAALLSLGRRLLGRPAGLGRGGAGMATAKLDIAVGMTMRRLAEAEVLAPAGTGFRAVVVTSGAVEAAERARVTRRLVHAAAMRGDRVLYIDATEPPDRRQPAPGLYEVLRGERNLDSVCVIEQESGIAIIGSGQYRPGQGDDAQRSAVRRFLIEARRRFHLVLVDGGVVSDNLRAAALVAEADAVIFVARVGETLQSDVTLAGEALEMIGRPLSAAVLVEAPGRG